MKFIHFIESPHFKTSWSGDERRVRVRVDNLVSITSKNSTKKARAQARARALCARQVSVREVAWFSRKAQVQNAHSREHATIRRRKRRRRRRRRHKRVYLHEIEEEIRQQLLPAQGNKEPLQLFKEAVYLPFHSFTTSTIYRCECKRAMHVQSREWHTAIFYGALYILNERKVSGPLFFICRLS